MIQAGRLLHAHVAYKAIRPHKPSRTCPTSQAIGPNAQTGRPIPSDSQKTLHQKRGVVLPMASHGVNEGVIANTPVDQLEV